MTASARWPFAARVLVVSVALAGLLAAAIIMLVVGRAVSAPAASSTTRTTMHRLGAPHHSTLSRRNGAPFLPAGLPTQDIGPPPGRLTPAQRIAQAQAMTRERLAATRLDHSARLAQVLHDELFAGPHGLRRDHHHGYNRRSPRP